MRTPVSVVRIAVTIHRTRTRTSVLVSETVQRIKKLSAYRTGYVYPNRCRGG
nr:MAG TPA: hypothetical protein [Caudoviricetes sp.]